jgi:pyridoxamine 5'-phosphate oxidase
MDFQEYVKFANEARTAYLATADGDQPRVRPMGMYLADKTGFYFHTESTKALTKQLNSNKKVELVFHSAAKVMRVTGKIKFINDPDLRVKILADRPFLKKLGIKGPDDPLFVVFQVYTGEAFFWTMADNMKEAEIDRAKF